MIRYIQHKDIDNDQWNACVYNSMNGQVYAYTWYLDALADEWDALVFDNYLQVMPLPKRKKWGIEYLYQPFFTQQLGIFSPMMLNADQVQAFLEAIPPQFRYVNYFLNEGNSFPLAIPKAELLARKNYILPLFGTHEQLQEAYQANTRRNIRKAKKAGVRIAESTNVNDALHLFQSTVGAKVPTIQKQDYLNLSELMRLTMQHQMGKIYTAYDSQNQLIASVFVLLSHSRITYLLPASTTTGKEKSAMFLLIDHIVEENQQSFQVLDFEGSMHEGIARFFQGFGATAKPYYHLHWNRLPWYLRWLKK